MAGYDVSKPGDSDIVSVFPSNERALRAFLAAIFGEDHEAAVGATQGFHKAVRMLDQGTPVAIAGGILYPKVVDGVSDLHYLNSAGTEIQITSGDGINVDLGSDPITTTGAITGGDVTGEDTVTGGGVFSSTFYKGKALELEIVAGAAEIDWFAASLYYLNATEDVTVTLTNMPNPADNQEQTVLFVVSVSAGVTITLDSAYTLEWVGAAGSGGFTEGGKDMVVATSYDGSTIQIGIAKNLG